VRGSGPSLDKERSALASDDLTFLSSLSAHPNRPGDTSNMNPAFAANLAAAIREAKAAGLNVGIESGYRAPTELQSQGERTSAARFDAAGNSLHSYGLAADISGLGGPNSKAAQQWAAIAARNGLYNPYGIGNAAEFNHWQALPYTLDQRPDVRAQLQQGGNALIAARQGPQPLGTTINASGEPASPFGADHTAFIRNYAKQIGLDPNLALGIANAEGMRAWSASNPNAASLLRADQLRGGSYGDFQLNMAPGAVGAAALAAGVDPRDPKQWQAADRFALDYMAQHGVGAWSGDPVAKQYQATGKVPAFTPSNATSTTGTLPTPTAAPGSVFGPPGAPSGTQPAGSILPGFGTQKASDQFTQGLQGVSGALGGGGPQAGGQYQAPRAPGPQLNMNLMARRGPGAMMAGTPNYGQAQQTLAQIAGAPLGQPGPMPQWNSAPNAPPPWLNVGAAQNPALAMGQQQLGMMNYAISPWYGTSMNSMPPDTAYGGFGGFGGGL